MFYSSKPFIFLSSLIMMMSTIMAVSSANWLFLWMAMELNLLSFIPLMNNSKSTQETEAAIKYFLAQSLGSSILLLSSLSLWMFPSLIITKMVLMTSILLKLGVAPLHFWYPSVMTSISWIACLILSTWQKIAPLMFMIYLIQPQIKTLILFAAALNALIGGMMGMNQSHMRTIMAYSSLTHMGWMMSLVTSTKPMSTLIYFFMYTVIITPIFMLFNNSSIVNNNQMNKVFSMTPSHQLLIPAMLMSLSGLPPLTGFIPKWMTISLMINSSIVVMLVLILGAMMNMFFYLNIIFFSLLKKHNTVSYSLTSKSHSAPGITTLILLSMIIPIMFIN